MKRIIAMTLAVVAMLGSTETLFAHEHRSVGKYELVVGFLNESAFSDSMNGVDLRVSSEGKPVEGLEENLQVAVQSPDGKSVITLRLRKRYKQPGSYAAYFLPTAAGKYTIQVVGIIYDQEMNETFASGPDTIHDVEDSSPLRFP